MIEPQLLAATPAPSRFGGVTTALAAVLGIILAAPLAGCIEGGRVTAPIPTGLFDGEFSVPDAEVDVAEVDAADSDVILGDADVIADADAADAQDGDAPDTADAETDACVPGTPGCPTADCTTDADCIALDDGDLCNGRFVCDAGACVADPTPVECPVDNSVQCYENACDPASGLCAKRPRPDGSLCTDLDGCTANDYCVAGKCTSGSRITCDDADPCTDDACGNGVCTHTPNTGPCDDGNACTQGDACNAGRCIGGQSVCPCTDTADCAGFDDGNDCNGVLSCVEGFCRAADETIVLCPASDNPCADNRCDPATGACAPVSKPDASGCSDGDACTVGDACNAGVCTGTALTCAGGACTTGGCDPATGCTLTPAPDGDACTGADGCLEGGTCSQGACVPDPAQCQCTEDADCAPLDDADLCNGSLACVEGRCVLDPTSVVICKVGPAEVCKQARCEPTTGQCAITNRPTGTPCSDGSACTSDDACLAGLCQGKPTACTGANTCNDVVCDFFSGCKKRPKGVSCAPQDACVSVAGCAAGQCAEVIEVECPTGDDCSIAGCDPALGGCVSMAQPGSCDDGDPCTTGDTCLGGACRGFARSCDDGNVCTLDACSGDGSCTHTPTSAVVCSDGNVCTTGDICTAGVCVGTPQAGCQCTIDADCAPAEDGDLCNGTLKCSEGACVVDPTTVVSCDQAGQGPCMANRCVPTTGQCAPVSLSDGLACKSDDACVTDGACKAGACVGNAINCDDGNPCTSDACDAVLGCVHEPVTGSCDDGNPCTPTSSCVAGVCTGGTNTCDCGVDADCAGKDDGNRCNGTLKCVASKCVADPTTVVSCPVSANPCVSTACQPATGKCVEAAKSGACEDGNPCTTGDTCANKVCQPGSAKTCTPGSACVQSSCDPGTGACVESPKPGTCNDQNPCTTGDTCIGGACIGPQNACDCSVDADCDEDIANKCLGTPVCGLAGCELLPGSAVSCADPSDTPCAFQECVPGTGACELTTLPTGATCQPAGKCFQPGSCQADGSCSAKPLVCDDKNPCTADTCDPAIGCVFTPLPANGSCDDGDACTTATVCQSGKCQGGLNTCSCSGQSDCDKLPVANRCDGVYTCSGGTCKLSPPVVCAATGKEPCLVRSCNPDTGTCSVAQASSGTPCNDNNACTSNDRCTGDTCVGTPKNCNDDNPCTTDACEDGQCSNGVLDSGPCDDKDPCTGATVCSGGVCGGGNFLCGCSSDGKCKAFDDGNACNGIWKCTDSLCQFAPGTEVTCTDPNPFDCIDVSCNPSTGGCVETVRSAGQACNDGSVCTTTDVCDGSGGCAGTLTVVCDDPDPNDCETVACDPKLGACVATRRADGAVCTDHDACTTGDVCKSGTCSGALLDCDDGNPCTVDSCSATSGCRNVQGFGPCEDGNPCTGGEICVSSLCKQGKDICGCTVQADCDFLEGGDLCGGDWKCVGGHCQLDEATIITCTPTTNPCKTTQCTGGACVDVDKPDLDPCDDGNPCTVNDSCLAGACVSGKAKCDDGKQCTTDTCNPTTGACTFTPKTDQTACSDGNTCNGADVCMAGACVSGTASNCSCVEDSDCANKDDGNLCNGTLVCRAGQCVTNPLSVVVCPLDPTGCATRQCNPATGSCEVRLQPNGTGCNDGDPCTVADTCQAGTCSGSPLSCDDDNPCTKDACLPYFGCYFPATVGACDDGDPCTAGDVCDGGVCAGTPNTCDDGNPCTKDDCVAIQGCRHINEAASKSCDDGNACTSGDKCNGGACVPGTNLCTCTNPSQCTTNLCLGPVACVAGKCVYDTTAKVTCPESTTCTTYTCDPATGSCDATVAPDDTACSDGSVCTTGDACKSGVCTPAETVTCVDDPSPCLQAVCDPVAGCEFEEVLASCDDSQACTINDQCVAGSCLGVPAASPRDSFDTGDLTDWSFASTGVDAAWQLTGAFAASSPLSLGAFNVDAGGLTDPDGPWTATATRAPVDVPTGLQPGAATLRLLLRMDVGDSTCFRILIDDALVDERCTATSGFVPVQVSLGDVAGSSVALKLEVVVDSETPTGTGVYVDDVVFDWACLLQ
ncbi:MAG: hypothetical protein H6744_07365 [Deltaproteobacteria bacterium]|nr:hypothetical protein [Deltaproteobacteria bacterium]